MDYASLDTERQNPLSANLDALTPLEAARLMNAADRRAAEAVSAALPRIAEAVCAISERLKSGGRLLYAGAGTSGRLGVLDASECPPTFGVNPGMVVGVIAGGDRALRVAVEGAEDSAELGRGDMMAHNLTGRDALVAISASGCAPYCVGALDYARSAGAYTIALCCNENSVMARHADLAIELATGPEILAGSTRLLAGTATKMTLNMLSTLSMIQLGKVYNNLMVDVQPSNAKLNDRAARIVASAVGLENVDEARALLAKAGGYVKLAIVCGMTGAEPEAARDALTAQDGFVRRAVKQILG